MLSEWLEASLPNLWQIQKQSLEPGATSHRCPGPLPVGPPPPSATHWGHSARGPHPECASLVCLLPSQLRCRSLPCSAPTMERVRKGIGPWGLKESQLSLQRGIESPLRPCCPLWDDMAVYLMGMPSLPLLKQLALDLIGAVAVVSQGSAQVAVSRCHPCAHAYWLFLSVRQKCPEFMGFVVFLASIHAPSKVFGAEEAHSVTVA